MALVTLSIPNEKLTLFSELLQALGISDSNDTFPTDDVSENTIIDKSNTFFKKYLDWDHNQNELEFE